MLRNSEQDSSTALLALSAAFATLYFVSIPWHPFPGSIGLKGASVAALALLAWISEARLLALGLAASSLGDVLLDIGANLFIPGLCAFLCAHVLYTIFFLRRWDRRPRGLWIIGLVLIYAVGFTVWLTPSLGPLTAPVAFYICAICSMVIATILSGSPWPVVAGAFLFLASDSLLAAAKFKGAFPLRDYLVWATYYMAQLGIASARESGSRE